MFLNPTKVKNLIVHHSATARDTTTFSAVKRYHMSLGWGDIGYHYFITGDGIIWPGRPESVMGAHCITGSMNYKSLGICLTGNFMKEEPSEAQKVSLTRILDNLIARYGLSKKDVYGHREVKGAPTACPGDNLIKCLIEYRK
jgi:N-acetylmuramoyl-L-alanine amidase